jgi:hypothetical protein
MAPFWRKLNWSEPKNEVQKKTHALEKEDVN